jgi:hypothetical protein
MRVYPAPTARRDDADIIAISRGATGQGRTRRFCCAQMTVPLHFYDMLRFPAAASVSWSAPVKAQDSAGVVA